MESIKNRIKEGYEDTMRSIEPILKMAEYKVLLEEKEEFPRLFKTYNYFKSILNKNKNKNNK